VTDLATSILGRTGVEVSILGYGAYELRGPSGPSVSDAEAGRLLNEVLDSGVNVIDTAIDYGISEDLIGRYIARRRDEYFLAGKCGCVVGQEGLHVHTAANIREGVETSLRRLKTDHLDLVQFHLSLTKQQMEEHGALQELLKLRDEGKVRYVGESGTLPNILEQVPMGVFDVFQVPYSALQREHEKVITTAAESGAGIIIRGGVAKGAPTGAWGRAENYMINPDMMKIRWEEAGLDDVLGGISRMEFMLRFTLSHPSLHTAIVGTSNIDHFHDNLAAAGKGPLPADMIAEAKRRLDAVGAGATA
jgi:aryl-alcohol dehydrogenase-like predicted oxidoreductase